MTPCTATHGDLRCVRLNGWNAHPVPHLASDGQQWDENGIRRAAGNNPYRDGSSK